MNIKNAGLVQYIIVLVLIYLSGSIYFIEFNYRSAVIFSFIAILIIYIFLVKEKKFQYATIMNLIVLVSLVIITVSINGDFMLSPYIAIILQIFIAFLTTKIIKIEDFKIMYIKIIVTLGVISLLFHSLGMINPSIITILPKSEALASVDYYNAIIHVYQSLIGYGRLVIQTRNSGIFWEPGAYQAFLNLGLIFFLENLNSNKLLKNGNKTIYLIFFITILSTYSTTGIILFMFISLMYKSEIIKIIQLKTYSDVVLMGVIFFVGGYLIINGIIVAYELFINKYMMNLYSIIQRLSVDKIELLFLDVKTFIFGMSFSNDYETNKIWNSIVQTSVVFGFPFISIISINYYRGSKYFVKKRWLLLIALVIIFSTENLIWRPLFLYITFAGSHSRIKENPPNYNIS